MACSSECQLHCRNANQLACCSCHQRHHTAELLKPGAAGAPDLEALHPRWPRVISPQDALLVLSNVQQGMPLLPESRVRRVHLGEGRAVAGAAAPKTLPPACVRACAC